MRFAVLLAAGQGTRMRSPHPKVLQPICGRPMVGWALEAAARAGFDRLFLVVGDRGGEVRQALERAGDLVDGRDELRLSGGPPVELVVQSPQLGTGHALQVALPQLQARAGGEPAGVEVTILYGDMPVLRAETLTELHAARPDRGASLLTARVRPATGYGRILREPGGGVVGIVEERDASPEQRAIDEVNVGVYAFPLDLLATELGRLSSDNAQGEFYLTDAVAGLVGAGHPVAAVELRDAAEARGVNTLAELSTARATLQERILLAHMANGVWIEDPASTYVDHGVEIGAGTRILPCSVLRRGVRVGEGCEVGPFTHLRVGTVLRDGAEVGNFTECKNADLGSHTKAKHLSYLGDVTIGERTNIGAGTIVANYDGKAKHPTRIGDRAFVGSGSILVAPSDVGDDALTGAGAVVTKKSIPAGEAWIGVPARRLERG